MKKATAHLFFIFTVDRISFPNLARENFQDDQLNLRWSVIEPTITVSPVEFVLHGKGTVHFLHTLQLQSIGWKGMKTCVCAFWKRTIHRAESITFSAKGIYCLGTKKMFSIVQRLHFCCCCCCISQLHKQLNSSVPKDFLVVKVMIFCIKKHSVINSHNCKRMKVPACFFLFFFFSFSTERLDHYYHYYLHEPQKSTEHK